ncbi:3-hexulose-6-phosphate synthase [Bifidobacterium margollesii]|uniref:3-hexulose-6-phosphate synthase n=1 Tax=Bifidobacterium margollesii TaxID=2020964 RepID=A0A2N5JCS7_9BIFI|nr:orotidine 5'-phosphate decarboxylase / HUMPS family protein [Bifidobacterium margollesii]PLS32006.1 3-hexulose-6-phosphate synthase [Bifidobacterium margollesii]
MKLQVAIDRVDVPCAEAIIREVAAAADVIEVGTSLTKEFGVRAITPLIEAANGTAVLGDIKTCDEGKYEFDLGFDCGFTYLTVMGSSSLGTLQVCYDSAAEHDGVMMIDLLECDDERIDRISVFPDAVYCLHTSVDSGATADPVGQVRAFKARYPQIRHIAIAGGIKKPQLAGLAAEGVEIVIMGSAITKADDIAAAAAECKALCA